MEKNNNYSDDSADEVEDDMTVETVSEPQKHPEPETEQKIKPKRSYVRKKPLDQDVLKNKLTKARATKEAKAKSIREQLKKPTTIINNYYYNDDKEQKQKIEPKQELKQETKPQQPKTQPKPQPQAPRNKIQFI